MLRAGGNAIDAAIAAIMTSTISESPLTGIGGGGYATIRTAEGELFSVDFFVDTPGKGIALTHEIRSRGFREVVVDFGGKNQSFHVGGGSVAVPGLPAGIEHMHRRFGSLPMTTLVQPACEAATDGFKMTRALSQMVRILRDISLGSETGRRFFAPKGKITRVGSRLRLPGAATFFENFAREGAESFYTGPLSDRIVEAVQADGGYLTKQDMAEYTVRERRPARGTLGDLDLSFPAPPNLGGPLISFGLALLNPHVDKLENFDEEALVHLCSAMSTTDYFRTQELDPVLTREYREPSYADDVLISRYRRVFQERIKDPSLLSETVPTHPIGSTTLISVVAADGSACSVTTSNGEGSTIWLEDQGILLNNMVGEEDLHPGAFHQYPAGVRLPSMMAPTIAIAKDGRTIALGSGGSNRLRSAILQVTLHHLGRGLSVQDATEHARIHLENGSVDVEPGFSDIEIDQLERKGVKVHRWKTTNLYFGGVHAVSMSPKMSFDAAGDPRRGGVSEVVLPG